MRKKKFRLFNPEEDYIEDLDGPSVMQRFFLITTDPIWYRSLLAACFFEICYCCHCTVVGTDYFTPTQYQFRMYGLIFNVLYFLEIFLQFTSVHMKGLKLPDPNPTKRPLIILFIELISVIPFEFIFMPKKPNDAELIEAYYLTKLIHTLKVVRLIYHFYINRKGLDNVYTTRLLEFICILIIYQAYMAAVYHFFLHRHDYEGVYKLYEIVSSKVNGKGSIVTVVIGRKYGVFFYEVPISISCVFLTMVIIKPTICFMILSLICRYEHKFNYVYKVIFFQSVAKRFNLRKCTYEYLMSYFEMYWKRKGGFLSELQEKAENITPFTLQVEMSMDFSWVAFQHSQLFRDMDIHFLRFIATLMTKTLKMKGEYVFKQKFIKNQMVYIESGVVDVLSNENGTTGVLRLTAGSCLGESSLLFPYVSNVNFRCSTSCELFVLNRSDFMMVTKKYPRAFNTLLRKIAKRLKVAKILHNKKQQFKMDKIHDLVWLKSNLHRLMAFNKSYESEHLLKNIYLSKELDYKWNSGAYTKKYLDLLVIKGRSASDMDLVYIRSTCLWILRPNSPIHKIWEYIIILLGTFAGIYIPYHACVGYNSVAQSVIQGIHAVWITDVLIQLITPASSESEARTVSEIFSERIKSFGFILDLIAIFELRFITPVLSEEIYAGKWRWRDINKTFKLWRLFKFFNTWESHFNLNILAHRLCKFVTVYLLLIYYISCIFKVDGIDDKLLSANSVQFATGSGFFFSENLMKDSPYYILANNLALIFEIITLVSITSAFYLNFITKRKIRQFVELLDSCAKKTVEHQLFERLTSYLNTQMNENEGLMVVTNTKIYYNLPADYEILIKADLHFLVLQKLKFFQSLPIEVIRKLSSTSEIVTYHTHAQILSRGVIYNEVFILLSGDAITISGPSIYDTKIGEPLNLLEICYETPAVCTVVALTEAMVVTFDYGEFVKLLKEYRQLSESYDFVIRKKKYIKRKLVDILKGKRIEMKTRRDQEIYSINVFPIYLPIGSFEEYDYFVPYDKLYPFSFIRIFLMRITINPDGRFLYRWEFVRCTLAYCSAIIFMVPPFALGEIYSFNIWMLFLLDLSAVLDLYVRLHVCYFNALGILIRHPLYTAKHYIKNGFFIDFLGMFPFYIFYIHNKVRYKMVLNIFHVLQLHRFVGLKKVHRGNWLSNTCYALLWYIFALNLTACVIYMQDCYDLEDDFGTEAHCKTFHMSNYNNYFHILFMVISTATSSGTIGIIEMYTLTMNTTILISLATIFGVFAKIILTAYIFSSYVKSDMKIFRYRRGFRKLILMLRSENVSRYLEIELKRYYTVYWDWLGRYNPVQLFQNLTPSLKRDLLFSFYGKNLIENSIFITDGNMLNDFYKNLLLEVQPVIIPKNGYVLTINDIQGYIFLLHSGSVDVIAADGSRLKILNEGSIFGNLENVELNRQKVSIVANTTVQAFLLKTTKFYTIIQYFPLIKEVFIREKLINLYYVKSLTENFIHNTTMHPHCRRSLIIYRHFKAFSIFHLIFCCYLGILLELYQLAVGEVTLPYLMVQYFLDAIHLAKQVIKFYVGYVNENNELVLDRKLIRAPHMKKFQLSMTIITSITPDVFLFLFCQIFNYELSNFSMAFTVLRLNRLTRFYYIIEDHSKSIWNATVKKSAVMNFFFVLYEMVVSTMSTAAVLALLDYAVTTDKSHVIRTFMNEYVKNLRSLNSLEKFQIYIKYFYYSITLHKFSTDNGYVAGHPVIAFAVTVLFLYYLVFDALLCCQYYEIINELYFMRIKLLKATNFLEYYRKSPGNSEIIKKKVTLNFMHYWDRCVDKDDSLLKENSPNYIKETINNCMYGHHFKEHPVFCNTHVDFLRQLGLCYKVVLYAADDTVAYKNDDRTCMYFIHKGEVAVLEDECDYLGKALHILKEGDSFGILQGLYESKVSYYTYRTITSCVIIELELKDWKHLLMFFPASKEFIYSTASSFAGKSFVSLKNKPGKKKKMD